MSGININDFQTTREKKPDLKSEIPGNLSRILNTEITLFSAKFGDRNKEAFYLELGTLLVSGMDIKASLELMEAEQENPKHAIIIRQLKDDLVGGKSLWEAVKQSGHFTPYEYYALQIGEETGKLNLVLEQLNQYYAARLKQRRQLMSALSYPIITLLTSIGAVSFMLLFIVPMFNDVFKRFGGELPGLTKFIIAFSNSVKSNFLWLAVLIAIISFLLYREREKLWMRKFVTRAVRRIPVIGKIIYSLQLARFCSSMSLLLGSKVPMVRSLNLVHQMITFYPIQVTLTVIEDDILHGKSLHASMASFDVYSRRMVSLIKVGEEVNKLDLFFEKLAKQYSTESEHQTGLLNTFLEPAMIIFLGLVVGFILLAMYLPMFQMSTNIGA